MVKWIRRSARARWTMSAAVTLAAVGAAAMPAAAVAQDEYGFDADSVWIKALDAGGNAVTQAAAHPDRLEINFRIRSTGAGANLLLSGLARDIEVTLPEGIQGNPEAVPKCPMAAFNREECPQAAVVGQHTLEYKAQRGVGFDTTPLYNLVSPEGVVARFGTKLYMVPVVLDMRVKSDGSYQIVTNIRNASQALLLVGSTTTIWGVPNANNGSTAPRIPLLTLGSQCGTDQTATIRANEWGPDRDSWIQANPTMPTLTGCDRLVFRPSMDVRPLTSVPDVPSAYRVKLDVPQNQNPASTAPPPLKRVEILFPQGTAISPGGANGLVGCSDAQAKLGVDASPSCPSRARIGSVQIDTPVIDVPLKGGVFLGTPKSQDSQSGEMFRIFLLASAKGVDIKQEGKIYPDPVTGRLKAVFDNAPQQPFETLTVDLDGGSGAALVNPAACGRHTTSATLTSWGGQTVTSDSSFEISCRPGLGGFLPSVSAGAASPFAGVSTPFNLSIQKPDGQSALRGVALELPPGLLANLKGNLGKVVGSVRAFAGTGAGPFQLPGTVTLEGPYGDAPFSLKVVVPAKAGPFDLGNVVVKQKLYVDPSDASVRVVSDPIPTILQGVPTRIQRLDVSIDKPGFMVNPTSCAPMAVGGALSSVAGQVVPVNVRFQVGDCASLVYKPDLDLRLRGNRRELRNGGHPRLDATLTVAKGEANQRKAQVTLPLNLALDPDNAKALCEPSAVPTNSCPAESIVGKAKAVSILDVPLEGPVFFVRGERTTSSGRVVPTLPKLFIPLKGQGVTINLHASSDVVDNKLQTTFDKLPDAPIERFELQINGGANAILKVTNGSVCRSTKTPKVGQRMVGQNGKVHRLNSVLGTGCKTAIVQSTRSGSHVRVTVGGQPAARNRLTVSGKGLVKASRTISARSTVATVKPRLNAGSLRALRAGRTLRIRATATVKPTAKGAKTKKVSRTIVVKPTKQERR